MDFQIHKFATAAIGQLQFIKTFSFAELYMSKFGALQGEHSYEIDVILCSYI